MVLLEWTTNIAFNSTIDLWYHGQLVIEDLFVILESAESSSKPKVILRFFNIELLIGVNSWNFWHLANWFGTVGQCFVELTFLIANSYVVILRITIQYGGKTFSCHFKHAATSKRAFETGRSSSGTKILSDFKSCITCIMVSNMGNISMLSVSCSTVE